MADPKQLAAAKQQQSAPSSFQAGDAPAAPASSFQAGDAPSVSSDFRNMMSIAPPGDAEASRALETGAGAVWDRVKHMPSDVYHAFTDPPRDFEERQLMKQSNIETRRIADGTGQVPPMQPQGQMGLGLHRLLVAPRIEAWRRGEAHFDAATENLESHNQLAASADIAMGVGHQFLSLWPSPASPFYSGAAGRAESGDYQGAAADVIAAEVPGRLFSGAGKIAKGLGQELQTQAPIAIAMDSAKGVTKQAVVDAAAEHGITLSPGQQSQDRNIQHWETRANTAPGAKNPNLEPLTQQKGLRKWYDELQAKVWGKGLSDQEIGNDFKANVQKAYDRERGKVDDAYNGAKDLYKKVDNVDVTPIEEWAKGQMQDPAKPKGQYINYPEGSTEGALLKRLSNLHEELNDKPGAPSTILGPDGKVMQPGPVPRASTTAASTVQFRRELQGMVDWTKPNAGRIGGIAKEVGPMLDTALENAASSKGPTLYQEFKDANAASRKLHTDFLDHSSPLSRALREENPETVARALTSQGGRGGSMELVDFMHKHGIDTSALKGYVLDNIHGNKFRYDANDMGGYSDQYLAHLLGPDDHLELNKMAQTAQTLKYKSVNSDTQPAEWSTNIKKWPASYLYRKAPEGLKERYAGYRSTPFSPGEGMTLNAPRQAVETGLAADDARDDKLRRIKTEKGQQ